MSSATTIHDGCGDIVDLLLLCIILIVFMSIRHYCLCTCIFILHSLHSLLIREQTRYKNTKNSWITCQILSFSVCSSKKSTQMFSKSALDDFSNWQICTCFGCFCTLIRRKREICQTFSPSFRDWENTTICLQFFQNL